MLSPTAAREAAGPIGRPLTVAFFIGSDVTSHIVANRLLPILLRSGCRVLLCLTRAATNSRRPLRLRQLHFVEHVLLQEHAYPFVDRLGVPSPDQFNTPTGWRELAPEGLTVREVADVNAPEFVAWLAEQDIDLGVSVRCYQRFREPILTLLSRPGARFVNLHPGLLPHYRGVNTFVRSMIAGAERAGFSLHDLEPEFDTGSVIGQVSFPLNYSCSVVENMITHAADAAGLILDLVVRTSAGEVVPSVEQDHGAARYFGHPTDGDLDRLSRNGVEVFRADVVIDVLAGAFFGVVFDVGALREVLFEAVRAAGVPSEDGRDRRLMLSASAS